MSRRDALQIGADARNKAARDALSIYRAGVEAVRADAVLGRTISIQGPNLRLGALTFRREAYRRIVLLGAGKASAAMAGAAEDILGDWVTDGLVVTREGHGEDLRRVRTLFAGHPVPDEGSLAAGRAMAELAGGMTSDDLAIVLLSGGASALLELPVAGIDLDHLRATNTALLRCGATIDEVNAVRRCLSRIKAGGLTRLLAPARIVCLVLSDVLGDPLSVIGSGPCWTESSSAPSGLATMERYGLEQELPQPVVSRLRQAQPPSDSGPPVDHIIVGNIRTAVDAARTRAAELGYTPAVLTAAMEGEARVIGALAGAMVRDRPWTLESSPVNCLIMGGETTVTVRGSGIGGRCQEFACAAMRSLSGVEDAALLVAGTDGTDGPTDAAGALIDGRSLDLALGQGLTPEQALAANDTYTFLNAAGSLIRTGPTGTNVGDLVIGLLAPSA